MNHDEIEDARREAAIEAQEQLEDELEERRAEEDESSEASILRSSATAKDELAKEEGCTCWEEPGDINCPVHSP